MICLKYFLSLCFLVFGLFSCSLVYSYSYDSTIISWSGYNWRVKEGYRSPGPNQFTVDSVQLSNKNETLSMVFQPLPDGNWSNSEIYSVVSLGYGTYSWIISSETASLPAQMTLGLFTWEDWSIDPNSREIDIEFAKWGIDTDPRNIQFTVQPHTVKGNARRYKINPSPQDKTLVEFTWSPCGVSFRGYKFDPSTNEITQYVHHTDNINHVLSGNEKVHMNFWMWGKQLPDTDSKPIKVDFESFTFKPLDQTDRNYIVGRSSIIYQLFPAIKSYITKFNSSATKSLAIFFDNVLKATLDRLC